MSIAIQRQKQHHSYLVDIDKCWRIGRKYRGCCSCEDRRALHSSQKIPDKLPDLQKLGVGGSSPLLFQCLRPCVDLRLKCVHDIRWLNGWVDEVLFAKLGPHLLERSPFSLEYSFLLFFYIIRGAVNLFSLLCRILIIESKTHCS